MTVVQNELDGPKERMLNTEMFNSKDTITMNNHPKGQNGVLNIILPIFNSNLQFEFSPCGIKPCHYLEKPPTVQCNCQICVFCTKIFPLANQKEFEGHPQQKGVFCISHGTLATQMSETVAWSQTNGYQNCHQQLWTKTLICQERRCS